MFKPATRGTKKLRMAIDGPSGSGKTWSALAIATGLGDTIALIDTERGSASLYSDHFHFCDVQLESFHPQKYIDAIKAAEAGGFDVLIIDSLTHAWAGKDGALDLVDKAAKRSASNNSFAAWREVTPLHNQLVDTILAARLHIICTLRVRTEYVLEEDSRGKKVPKKVGLAPIQRDGMEYEFDLVCDMNMNHELIVGKTRISDVDGEIIMKPDRSFGERLRTWLVGGVSGGAAPSQVREAVVAVPTTERRSDPAATESPEPEAQAEGSVSRSVGKEEMLQLLEAATANGWTREQVSDFLCAVLNLEPATFAREITWKQWEWAVKLFLRPENAGGKVLVSPDGTDLPIHKRWPPQEVAV